MIKFQDNGIAYINCPECDRKIILHEKWQEDIGRILVVPCLCGCDIKLGIPRNIQRI
jgi:DNA-directed RNA polymerase subunit RPC12/RpoP